MALNLDFSFYNWDLISNFVLKGLYFSLMLTLIATVGGVLLGTVLALMRLSGQKWLQVPAVIYVNGMRSIPLVMVILWFFLLMPAIIGRPIGAELSAVITFVAFEAAYFSEIMRAGIQSQPRGQRHAAMALGMSTWQTYRYVLIPTAVRIILPPLTSEAMNLVKNSAAAFAVSIAELSQYAMQVQEETSRSYEVYIAVTGLYMLSAFAVNRLFGFIEQRSRIPGLVVANSTPGGR